MKNITFLLVLFLQTSLFAQINGNKDIITKSFPLEALSKLEINLTADITIDAAAPSGITITADENVLDYINLKAKNGRLDLTQLDWIEPSRNPQIVIGAPKLKTIILDAHSRVLVENLNAKNLKVKANVGWMELKGQLNTLDLKVKVAEVNTEELELENANVTIKSWGKVWLGKVKSLSSDIDESGSLSVEGKLEKLSGDAQKAIAKDHQPIDSSIRFIEFKVRNNSLKRNHFYVVGPKSDGSYFSYGFPMNPGQIREKSWTVGSKVYKVNKLGFRKLIATITAKDENETVELFQNKKG